MGYKQFFYIKVAVLATVVCVIIFMSVLFVKLDKRQMDVQQNQLESYDQLTDTTDTIASQQEDVSQQEVTIEGQQIQHYLISKDVRSLQSIDDIKAVSAYYDNTRTSRYYYTGIPQVDNCITTLAGSDTPELIADYDDYLGTERVHIYIVGISGSAYAMIYIPESEAIALPLKVSVTEYVNGTPYRTEDINRGYDD